MEKSPFATSFVASINFLTGFIKLLVRKPINKVKTEDSATFIDINKPIHHRLFNFSLLTIFNFVPIENPSTSMVAVVTKADGTKQVMRKSVVRETGLTFLANGNLTIEIVDNHKTFTDVNSHWASNAIDFVSSHELYNGTSQNIFSPNATMTRAMLVQVLHNMEHNPKAENNQTFSDVKSTAWFADAVQWSVANGIVSGQDANTFAPQKNITREDLAVILHRYAGNPTPIGKELQFKDANQVSGYANDAINWAVENGILNGTSNGTLNPKSAATRAEVAAVLMCFLNKTM